MRLGQKFLAISRNLTSALLASHPWPERMVIVVEIEDRCAEKPFLGGWRNVVTGAEYHDALTQTCPGDRVYRGSEEDPPCGAVGVARRTANVITQTVGDIAAESTKSVVVLSSCSKYTSVPSDRATQTSRLPDLRDKLVTPLAPTFAGSASQTCRYSDEGSLLAAVPSVIAPAGDSERRIVEDERMLRCRLEEECAVKIQRCYRAYRARLDIGALARLSGETRALTPPEPEKIHRLRHCRASRFELVNASPPKKRSDFEILQNVLGRWRVCENARIDRTFFGTSKLAARTMVLLKEIELLRSIESIKTRVCGERRRRRYLEDLERLAKSEVWTMPDGRKILVDTPRVQRARECREFYRSLLNEDPSTIERSEALRNLKLYAAEHTCRSGRDVVSLIDQELELLAHSVDPRFMDPLRNRLKIALLRLSTSHCEPSGKSGEEGKLPNASGSRADSSFKLCSRCGKFLHLDGLASSLAPSGLVTCENCKILRPGKDPTIVYEPYDLMLRELRNRETDLRGEIGGPAFAVDTRVIYRLVNYVWHGKSGISECDDLFRLTLVRFRTEREWAPWNTLLLTKREAALHQAMDDPWHIYSPSLTKKFVVKNLQAKLRFDFMAKAYFW